MSENAAISPSSVEREIERLRRLRRGAVGVAPGERVREEDVARRIEALGATIRGRR